MPLPLWNDKMEFASIRKPLQNKVLNQSERDFTLLNPFIQISIFVCKGFSLIQVLFQSPPGFMHIIYSSFILDVDLCLPRPGRMFLGIIWCSATWKPLKSQFLYPAWWNCQDSAHVFTADSHHQHCDTEEDMKRNILCQLGAQIYVVLLLNASWRSLPVPLLILFCWKHNSAQREPGVQS